MPFKYFKQQERNDCGPTCLRMAAEHYGRKFSIQALRQACDIEREGVSLLGISYGAEKIGFDTEGVKLAGDELKNVTLPCILHWHSNHFVVLYKIKNNFFYIADPGAGRMKLPENEFNTHWFGSDQTGQGHALLLTPSARFYNQPADGDKTVSWAFILNYLVTYRKLLVQLLIALGLGSLLQLIAPFLTQAVVDTGIHTGNISFVYLILIAQFALIIGRVSLDFFRSWILLHISTRINISILTDFLIKLMKLPISFFDARNTGDIMLRINDQRTIESFLTGTTLSTVFSLFNLIIFSFILAYYNLLIFTFFVISSVVYTAWITFFLKYRRVLNYRGFDVASKNQSNIIQLVNGMQEIKLNNCEQQKRFEWENLQVSQFKLTVKNLTLSQYQQGGSTFINEGANLIITFLCAKAVINGQLTLGAMIAVQYIIGQLSGPVQQVVGFTQNYQDAKISLERLNEIHNMPDEEVKDRAWQHRLPADKSIAINNLTFTYRGAGNQPVLKAINLLIPQGKTTAVVGMSGSGKTTLLKLLMRFYEPGEGSISVGGQPLRDVSFKTWRAACGVVMQDGYIFADTVARNIAVGIDEPNAGKLEQAIKIANIQELADTLPQGLDTLVGAGGNGISQGQRQRLLIARAVYKNPAYLFFDEATNALDTTNERIIMDNLQQFFAGRTVVIVAHRLSTVSNADNIILLDKGRITEQGTHSQLTALRGGYYTLVKNQLELGN